MVFPWARETRKTSKERVFSCEKRGLFGNKLFDGPVNPKYPNFATETKVPSRDTQRKLSEIRCLAKLARITMARITPSTFFKPRCCLRGRKYLDTWLRSPHCFPSSFPQQQQQCGDSRLFLHHA